MKTLIVECKYILEVPWDTPEDWPDDHIRFRIEENSCPGTGSVGSVLDDLMEVAQKNRICWACSVGGENKLLAIEDREPRNYVDEIQFKKEKTAGECPACGAKVTVTTEKNGSITKTRYSCRKCKSSGGGMEMFASEEP